MLKFTIGEALQLGLLLLGLGVVAVAFFARPASLGVKGRPTFVSITLLIVSMLLIALWIVYTSNSSYFSDIHSPIWSSPR